MQNAEIELKVPISDPAAFESRLREHGFHIDTPRTFEHNTLYDTPARDLRSRIEILRIRRYGNLCTVTHKRTTTQQNPTESARYKVRIETETTVADGEALATIFQHLGYIPAFTYEKYRTEYCQPGGGGIATIDETPVGVYLELEGRPAWIDRTARTLGFAKTDYILDSYGKLYLRWAESRGIEPRNMVFQKK